MNIALTGFMGCGKTSVGKALAELLPEYSLIDLDEYIESMTGRRIPDIFKEDGEQAFRTLEAQALGKILIRQASHIISLGGGTITTEPCRKLIHEHSVCFYLKASSDTLVANLLNDSNVRPLLSPDGSHLAEPQLRARIEQLMSERTHLYESAADHIISTDGLTYEQAAAHIISLL